MKKLINGKYYDLTPEEIAESEARQKEMEAQMPHPQPTADDAVSTDDMAAAILEGVNDV